MDRVKKILRWSLYPIFYVFCLVFFAYLTFPYDRLRDRLVAEFAKSQANAKDGPQRLEIDGVDSYWVSGVELTGVRIITPPSRQDILDYEREMARIRSQQKRGMATDDEPPAPPKASEMVINEAHVRARILPLLIGDVVLDVWASAFGGEVSGTIPIDGGAVELSLENVELGLITPLSEATQLPLAGRASGTFTFSAPEGQVEQASGGLTLTVTDASMGDGKTKIADMLAIPKARLGNLEVQATVQDGNVNIDRFEARGPDMEFIASGRIALRDPIGTSQADLFVRFLFTDTYRGKSDKTMALLGDPSGKGPPGIVDTLPKTKRAKREDGFYGFKANGTLKRLRFNPSPDGASAGAATPGARPGTATTPRPTPGIRR